MQQDKPKVEIKRSYIHKAYILLSYVVAIIVIGTYLGLALIGVIDFHDKEVYINIPIGIFLLVLINLSKIFPYRYILLVSFVYGLIISSIPTGSSDASNLYLLYTGVLLVLIFLQLIYKIRGDKEGRRRISTKGSTIKKIGILIFLAFAVFFASRYNPPATELQAILESPAADLQLLTAQEVERLHEDTSISLGTRYRAETRIKYKPVDGHTKEDVFNEIVDLLENSGWNKESSQDIFGGYYRASLPYNTYQKSVYVTEVEVHNTQLDYVSVQITAGLRLLNT